MKRYELVLRDRSGRAGRFRSLKFLSRAVIFRHAEPGTRFSLRTDSCSEWHGAGASAGRTSSVPRSLPKTLYANIWMMESAKDGD